MIAVRKKGYPPLTAIYLPEAAEACETSSYNEHIRFYHHDEKYPCISYQDTHKTPLFIFRPAD